MSRTISPPHEDAFGKRIYEERAKRGWSREDVVDKLLEIYRTKTNNNRELSPSVETIKRWERGENKPTRYYRDLLSQVFQMDRKEIDDLIVISVVGVV